MQQQRSQKTPPLFTGNRLQLEPATTSVSDLMSRLHCYLPGEELDEHWQSSATPYNTSTKVGGSDTAVPLKSAAPDLRERLPGTGPGPRVLPAVKLILQTSIPDGAVAHLTDAARICHKFSCCEYVGMRASREVRTSPFVSLQSCERGLKNSPWRLFTG
ncbi:hypothetical protein AGIG_G5162 [Arapaima gigas]